MGGIVEPNRPAAAGGATWTPLDRPGPVQPPRAATPAAPPTAPHPHPHPDPQPNPHPYPPRPVPARVAAQVPSGLFPGAGPRRPVYREPLPIRPAAVSIGTGGGALWMMLFGLLAHNARGYAWATIVAALLAWPVLAVLGKYGDRGVATGAATTVGIGLSIAGVLVAVRWIGGDWLLW